MLEVTSEGPIGAWPFLAISLSFLRPQVRSEGPPKAWIFDCRDSEWHSKAGAA